MIGFHAFKKALFYLLLSWLFISQWIGCAEPEAAHLKIGYYHWKTAISLSSASQIHLKEVGAERLYVKFFDVDYDPHFKDAEPLGILQIDTMGWSSMDWVPVVFLTNRTLERLSADQLDSLAHRLVEKMEAMWQQAGLADPMEWQLDCDWTGATRAAFFKLCRAVKALRPHRLLSSTIRLHQIKYREQTGVPPVDRGMLMFYNMDAVDDPLTENSILDLSVANAYLSRLGTYPLSLDVALPAYGWGVVFRGQHFVRLLSNVYDSDLDSTHFKRTVPGHFKVSKQTYFNGHLLYEGDEIRMERAEPEDLAQAWELLIEHLPAEDRDLVFYHLEDRNVRWYGSQLLRVFDR